MKRLITAALTLALLFTACDRHEINNVTVKTFDSLCSPFNEHRLDKKLSEIRHVVFDMDGTIYMDGVLFPFTHATLDSLTAHGIGYSFLTNNPSKNIGEYIDRLHGLGIDCTEDNMFSPVAATAAYLKKNLPSAKRLFMLGTPSMIEQFEEAGYTSAADTASDRPDAVIVAFDMTLTYSRLCRAAWWVSQGVPYIATNPDRVCPTSQPTVLVDCGSLCAAIQTATGRKPDVVIGKPAAEMLVPVEQHNGLAPSQIAMVGDRIYTDVQTAHNAGAFGVLVLTGETSLETALSNKPQPDLTAKNIYVFCQKLIAAQKKAADKQQK